MGLLPPAAEVIGGEVSVDGEDLLGMRSKRRDGVRGGKQSGLGREGGPDGLDEYRQLKYLAVPGFYT